MRKALAMVTVVSMLLAGLMASAMPVAAKGKPVIFTQHFEATWEVWDCGDFSVIADGYQDRWNKLFYDEDGTLTKVISHWQTRVTLTNSVTGKSMNNDQDLIRILDYEEKTITVNGVPQRFTVPGEGIVVQGVGTVTLEFPGGDPDLIIHEGGYHPFLHGEITDEVYCEYLG